MASGFWAIIEQIGRHPGKKGEPGLFAAWGGTPTTILLRHRGNPNPVLLHQLHERLARLSGLKFPTATEETADPQGADHVYEAATDYLRNNTRNKEQFPLVFAENCNYGFRRNAWGLCPWAIGICVLAALATGALAIVEPSFVKVERGLLLTLIALDVAAAAAWWKLVNRDWVRQPAFAYAHRLLEAAESLSS